MKLKLMEKILTSNIFTQEEIEFLLTTIIKENNNEKYKRVLYQSKGFEK